LERRTLGSAPKNFKKLAGAMKKSVENCYPTENQGFRPIAIWRNEKKKKPQRKSKGGAVDPQQGRPK